MIQHIGEPVECMCCDSTVECCGFDVLRRFNDPIVQADLKLLPYQVVCVDGDKPCVSVEWKQQTRILTTEEISAMILSRMKETAEAYLGALCLFLRVFTEVALSTHR